MTGIERLEALTRMAPAIALVLVAGCADSGGGTTTTAAQATTVTAPSNQASTPATEHSTSTTATDETGEIEIEIEDGRPQGGVRQIQVDQGDRVSFKVKSDSAEEIHVHGYDLSYEVEAGGSVEIEFDADVPGIFEIELEDSSTLIAELRVG